MMDIYVLNKNLERVGIVDNYNSVIWANRYAQRGDCEVYVPATSENLQLIRKGFYLERDDDGMVCQIKKIQLDTDAEDGNYLTVSGYDVKGFLDQRVIWGTATCNGNVEAFNRKLVSDALISPSIEARGLRKENGGQLLSLEAAQEFTEETSEQVSYKNVGEKIRETCQKYGWGYRIFRENSGLKFGFYKGTNRTSEVIFSDEFENLASTTYKSDDTKLGNVALVAGAGEGAERARSVYGYQEGVDRYELFVDAKDVAKNVRYSDLKNAFPLVADGGSGYITTAGGKPVYAVGTLIIRVLDGNQLAWLRAKYPSGTETTVDGVIFFSITDCVIADLLSSAPADGDTVTYRDVVYSAYLLERGYQKVVEYGETESFEGSVIPDITFTYKQDYFLGDIVKVRNEYGIEANARIVEVVEVQDVNGYRIEPKFEYLENGVAEYVEVPTGKAQEYEEGNGSPLADTVENLSDEVDVIKSGYLPLTGGTVTGQVKSIFEGADGILVEHGKANTDATARFKRTDTGVGVMVGVGSGGVNHGLYSDKLGKWLVYGDASKVYLNGMAESAKDYNNNVPTKFGYSTARMTSFTHLACWDTSVSGEYRLRSAVPQDLRNLMGLGNTTGALPIANGGTGATSESAARSKLNATYDVAVEYSGNGSSTDCVFINMGADATIDNVVFPRYSKGVLSTNSSKDATLYTIDTVGNLYTAFRNNGTWSRAKKYGSTSLWSGTLGTSAVTITNAMKYDRLLFVAQIGTSLYFYSSLVVPTMILTTSDQGYEVADDSSYVSFNLKYSGNNVVMTRRGGSNSSCTVYRVIGIN